MRRGPVLAELNQRGVKFLTLRMRSPALVRQIDALTDTEDYSKSLERMPVIGVSNT